MSSYTEDFNGQKLPKAGKIIHLIGTLDELNSYLGLIKALLTDDINKKFLEEVQIKLMKLMSHVSDNNNENYYFSQNDIDDLENEIDRLSVKMPKLSQFILPGSSVTEAHVQIARTITRKAERYFYSVNKEEEQVLCVIAGEYLNRLSDYMFILSQTCIIYD